MATAWHDSDFPSFLDDELDDVFEPAPSVAFEVEPQKECRVSDAAIDYVHDHLGASITNNAADLKELVTLNSLSGGRDSGYVPSPPSYYSFTSSSDEDESTNLTERSCLGVTPPITILRSSLHPTQRRQGSRRSHHENFHKAVKDSKSMRRGRSKSCPATSRASGLQCLQMSHSLTVTPVPVSGNISFMSADRKCLLMSAYKTANITTVNTKDVIEKGTYGQQCCVLVLALPDYTVNNERHSSNLNAQPSPPSSRPSRVRALSCEVTLAEEVGRKLRWIADSFSSGKAQLSEASPTNSNACFEVEPDTSHSGPATT